MTYAVIGGLSIGGAPKPSGEGVGTPAAAIAGGAETGCSVAGGAAFAVISCTNCCIDSSGVCPGYLLIIIETGITTTGSPGPLSATGVISTPFACNAALSSHRYNDFYS